MRIVVISDHETAGGAAIAGSRLVWPIAHRHEVHYLVHNADGQSHPWKTWPLRAGHATDPPSYRGMYPVLDHGWRRGPYEPVVPIPSTLPRELNARLRWLLSRLAPHVIWIQNLHGGSSQGWSPEIVEVASYFGPVVWTLHDMWSFTGRCAYSYDCRAFETGCSQTCPTPGEYPSLQPEAIAPAWALRQRVLRGGRTIRGVAPSRWLAEEAIRGAWPASSVEMIASGIPLAMYRPLDRKLSRVKLGLPDDGRPLVLVSAHNLTDRRKGGGILPELLRELQTRPMVLIFMGQGVIPVDSPGITTISLGFVNDPAAQAEIYSAVDLMLHPAPVDNLPNVIIESLACGTPVVAYPIGGVPEMILPGVTGWLAANFGARGLAQTLDRACWQIRGGLSLRESCRSFASEHFDDQDRAADYEDLFENLVGDFPTIEPNRPFRLPFRPSPHRQAG